MSSVERNDVVSAHPLDMAARASLTGPHARFAEVVGAAARYPTDVAFFAGLADPGDPAAWTDLAKLVGVGAGVSVSLTDVGEVPDGWETVRRIPGVQLVATALRAESDPDAVVLGAADVPDMLDLVDRTHPGPFLPRTVELGTYLGIRREGRLVAMAGERLRPPGWTEISAVCTDPAFQGQGLASRLIRAVAAGIEARGERAFLHTGADNATAIRLYERLGFTRRRDTTFLVLRTPGGEARNIH